MKRIRCGIVGYGPVFNFGKAHGGWIRAVPELELAAICDRDPARAEIARQDFPGVVVYTSLPAMLKEAGLDLASVVVPHCLHREVVVECLRAGKHTVVDKPMATTVDECVAMMAAAEEAGRTLAVFHNRRHDGNYRTVHRLVRSGALGDVFHIEVWAGGYGRPGSGWRSKAAITGGALYDWGAHAVDWVLNLVPSRPISVTGFSQKRIWHEVDIEDEAQAVIRFENGAVASVFYSSIALTRKPLWRIHGTRGAIQDTGDGSLKGYCPEYLPVGPSGGSLQLIAMEAGGRRETTVPYEPSDWFSYYADMARHLREGAPVPVSASEGRRVIAVLERAKRSSASGSPEALSDV